MMPTSQEIRQARKDAGLSFVLMEDYVMNDTIRAISLFGSEAEVTDLNRTCWQLNTNGILCKYRVEVFPTMGSYWRSKPLSLTITAFNGDDSGVSWHNLEVILNNMFPDLVSFDVKWVKPVVNRPAE